MADIASDANTVHVINTPNRGVIRGLPGDVVVEVSVRIEGDRIEPIHVDALRPDVDALVRTVKDFELLTVQAAVDGDRDAAIRALVTNPLGPSISDAPAVWARLVEVNQGWLGTARMTGLASSSASTVVAPRPTSWSPTSPEPCVGSTTHRRHQPREHRRRADDRRPRRVRSPRPSARPGCRAVDVRVSVFGLAGVDWPSDVVMVDGALVGPRARWTAVRGQRFAGGVASGLLATVGHRVEHRHRFGDRRRQPLTGSGSGRWPSDGANRAAPAPSSARRSTRSPPNTTGRARPTALTGRFLERSGNPTCRRCSSRSRAVDRVGFEDVLRWSSSVAAGGDDVARSIVVDSLSRHAAMVGGVATHLGMTGEAFELVTSGGVHCRRWRILRCLRIGGRGRLSRRHDRCR